MKSFDFAPPEIRVPTRVELEPDGSVDVFVDEDEEAVLVTAQDGVRKDLRGCDM